MKRIVLGLVAVAAAGALAAPASGHVYTQSCYYETFPYPCRVCVHEGPLSTC